MKIFYTILFFLDVALLAVLSSDLFKMIDKQAGCWAILIIIIGMAVCIVFLVFFLLRYLGETQSHQDN